MGKSRKEKIVEALRLIWAVLIFAFMAMTIIYYFESDSTKEMKIIKISFFWTMVSIVILGLEYLNERVKSN